MSRTNPYKKKLRSAKETLLMFVEGLGEEIFLKYVKGLYNRDSGIEIKIRNGKGGNAVNIVIDASNVPGSFERRMVVLDNDKGMEEMQQARKEAARRGIELKENTPCLEALLLAILNVGKTYSDKSSQWCKNEFESKYLDKKKRIELNEYEKHFPRDLLEKQRLKLQKLNEFISIMEGH